MGFVKLTSTLAFIVCAQILHAESVRGTVVGSIGDDGVTFHSDDIVVVEAQAVPDYQEGLELQIDIPENLQRYPNSFALLLYSKVSPTPEIGRQSYTGTRVYMRLIPPRDSMFLRIPFSENHSIIGDALTYLLPMPVKPEEFPLLLTILPMVKGVPDSVYSQNFTIRASELWKNEGTVTVTLTNLSGSPEEIVMITIDGDEVVQGEKITLDAGIHKIHVRSTHAPIFEQTVVVEPGEAIDVPISLDYRPPEMTVNFLEGSRVLLDGKEIEMNRNTVTLEIEPGEHEVTGILGDYKTSKRFSIRPGGRVNIELLFDIKITEYGNESGNPFGSGE